MNLGDLIKNKREELNISQRKLAKISNIDCAELSRIESNKRKKPNVIFLKSIASNLDLSLEKLMLLAGYNQADINWSNSKDNSVKNYQSKLENYQKFYFDILENIESRRKNAFACKGVLADLIEQIENEKISNEKILENLKEIIKMIRPNLEKFDLTNYNFK